jgi:predicted HTH domain antitoxin
VINIFWKGNESKIIYCRSREIPLTQVDFRMVRYKHPKPTGSLDPEDLSEEDSSEQALESETLSREPLSKGELPVWKELRILVAAKLYGSERLSSERAAKLAGINHVEFLLNLGFYKVFPLQAELHELEDQRE